MSEVSPVIIKKTQNTLGRYVKKPNLSDALLRKPPFKFLQDVIKAIIQNTGFFNGLYTDDELISENVKDREAKINFLQKAIDVVKISTKENLKARPSKIVAGLEPERTNEWLQAIGAAIDNKISSEDAVRMVRDGGANAEVKENKVAKKKDETGVKKKEKIKESSENKNDSKGTSLKNGKAKSNTVKRETSVEKKEVENGKKVQRQPSKESESSKSTKTGKTKIVENGSKKPHGKDSPRGSKKSKESDQPNHAKASIHEKANAENGTKENNTSSLNGQREEKSGREKVAKHSENGITKDVIADIKPSSPPKELQIEKKQPTTPEKSNVALEESVVNDKQAKDEENGQVLNLTPTAAINNASETTLTIPPAETRAKPSEKMPSAIKSKSSKSSTEAKKSSYMKSSAPVDESTAPARTTTTLRAPTARPPSARPGAPRRRDRNVEIILQAERTMQEAADKNTPVNNIVADLADDGENLVVIDNTNIQGDELASTQQPLPDADVDEREQGHLVQQILETQTALSKKDTTKNNNENEIDNKIIERQPLNKDLEIIKDSIQKMTRFISPLGKLLEYVHEDVDAMQSELVMWRQAHNKAVTAIKREREQFEKAIESSKYQLFEIETQIEDHNLQINNTMANIIENEGKLFKMVHDV